MSKSVYSKYIVQNVVAINEINLQAIDDWLLEECITLDVVGEAIPAIFYTMDPDLTITYMNAVGYQWLNREGKAGIAREKKYVTSYYHPEHSFIAHSQMIRFYNLQNFQDIQYDIQRVWFPQDAAYKRCLITTKLSHSIKGLISTIVPLDDLSQQNQSKDNWGEEEKFARSHHSKYERLFQ